MSTLLVETSTCGTSFSTTGSMSIGSGSTTFLTAFSSFFLAASSSTSAAVFGLSLPHTEQLPMNRLLSNVLKIDLLAKGSLSSVQTRQLHRDRVTCFTPGD